MSTGSGRGPAPTELGAGGCLNCQGRPHSEWCVLSGDDVRVLSISRTVNVYEPGQVIFYQGNPCLGIYCVEQGEVALRRTDEAGHSAIVRLAHAGQTLGYRSFFADSTYSASAEALTECRVCFVDRAAVRRLLDANPSLGLQFLQRVAQELAESEESRLVASTMPARARLAHLLLSLRERCGRITEAGDLVIDLPLSRQDLAALLGTRPETVSRAIRALEDDGVAEFSGRHVLVGDLDLLLDELEPPAGGS